MKNESREITKEYAVVDDDDDERLLQARQGMLQCGLNVDFIDDLAAEFQTADENCAGLTDLFIEELLTRLMQFTMSPNELQHAINRATM